METENGNVRWIGECYRRQYFLALCLTSGWFLRLISCSQLQYMTEADLLTSGVVIVNAVIAQTVAKTIKKHNSSGQQISSVVLVGATFSLVFSFFALISSLETFKIFVDLFACERLAFDKVRWTEESGLVGEIQKCSWPMAERSDFCFCNGLCRLDNRSMEMITKQHWKRSFGLFNNDLVLFFVAVIIFTVLETCVPLFKILFQSCCRSNAIEEEPTVKNEDAGVDDSQGPEWTFQEEKPFQSPPIVNTMTPPPPYEV